MDIVSIEESRALSGAPTDLISDSTIREQINLVESKTKDLFRVELTPTKKIETLTGEFKQKLLVDEYFPLKVFNVKNGDTIVDLENVYVHNEEGFIELYGEGNLGSYPFYRNSFSGYELDIKIKYLYGMIQRDNKSQTETTTTTTKGSSVDITVESSDSFTVGDYCYIEDLNKKKEVFKITSIPDSTTITSDILVNDYEYEALVTKTKTHDLFKQFIAYESAICTAINAIGSTYQLATGYTQEGVSAQIGVAWTHWRNNLDSNIKQRDIVLSEIKKLLGTIV